MQIEQVNTSHLEIQAPVGFIDLLQPQMEQSLELMALEVPEHLLHSIRVAEIARLLAQIDGHTPVEQLLIFHETLVHDIGKIFIRKSTLYKPGKPEGDERDEIEIHPDDGAWLLRKMGFPVGHIQVAQQHQRYLSQDGYPKRIKPEKVSRISKIVMTADVQDAILDPRRKEFYAPADLEKCKTIMHRLFDHGKLYPEMRPVYDALLESQDFQMFRQQQSSPEDIAYFFETRALEFMSQHSIIGKNLQLKIQKLINLDYAVFAQARNAGRTVFAD